MANNHRSIDELPLDFENPATGEFLNQQKQKFEKKRDSSATEANNSSRSTDANIMLITTVLITASVFVLGNSQLLGRLSHNEKLFIFYGLLSEALSVLMGIVSYLASQHFFNAWAKRENQAVLIIEGQDFTTVKELRENIAGIKTPRTISSYVPLILQVAFLLIGLIMYLSAVADILHI